MRCDKHDLLLYAVAGRAWLNGDQTLVWQVEEAIKGGATMNQLREGQLDYASFLEEGREIKALCRQYHIPFLISDNAALAVKLQADGVHVGQHNPEVGKVRALIGPDQILGVSVQTVEQALAAQAEGADYLSAGAVFPSDGQDAGSVSLDTLRAICRAVKIPVAAAGGITPENIAQLAHSGICGVAAAWAIFAQPNIRTAAFALQNLAKRTVYGG